MQLPAQEVELYSMVKRKFRSLFVKQENMKTFKMYDRVDTKVFYTDSQ